MITPELKREIREAHERLMGMGPEERVLFLNRLRQDRPVVHGELLRMICEGSGSDLRDEAPPSPSEGPPRGEETLRPSHDSSIQGNRPGVAGVSMGRGERSKRPFPSIPGFEILAEIGRGGMGVVYKAKHLGLERMVALKMILHGDHASESAKRRFLAEAKSVAKLDHPNIVRIHEIGEHDGNPYFALEFVDGHDLAKWLKKGPLGTKKAVLLVERLAHAMHAAHEVGVIHRDLKPANILVTKKGAPKVTDFGLAKKMDARGGMTKTDAILGTPQYMAPEQARGENKLVDVRTDVYALGAILYACLTGRPPFEAETLLHLLAQVDSQAPTPLSRLVKELDEDLETICLTCLEKDPKKRYATAKELAEDLKRFREGDFIAARPVGRLERALRICKRNPVMMSMVALMLLLFAAGTTISTIFAVKATESARQAEELAAKEGQARKELQEALRMAQAADKERGEALAEKGLALSKVKQALSETEAARKQAEDLLRKFEEAVAKEQSTSRDKREALISLYIGRLSSARQALSRGRNIQARAILESCNPEMRGWEHAYLLRQADKLRLELRGHTAAVNCVAIIPDAGGSPRLVSGSDDKTVKVWDLRTGKATMTLGGHEGPITSIAFRRYGLYGMLVTGSEDKTLKVWDLKGGTSDSTLEGHTAPITCVAYSPNGSRMCSGSENGNIRVWYSTGKPALVCRGHYRAVNCVAFSPDSTRIVSGGADRTLRIWSSSIRREPVILSRHRDEVTAVVIDGLGKHIVSAGKDKTIRVWDAATGRERLTLEGHTAPVTCVAFDSKGERIVSGSEDKTVRVWDVERGRESSPSKRTARRSGAWPSVPRAR